MENRFFSIITGTGRYVPQRVVKNEDFLKNEFFDINGEKLDLSNADIIDKFRQITEIDERRYVDDKYVTSDIGFFAAREALESSKINKEELDYIIVAHNFGDVKKSNQKSDMVPTIAARIKHSLGIVNPYTVAYDLPFGCPGWLQALIQADYYIRSGDAKKILVIGCETLSRVSDPHDRDSMLYSDGAGAVVLEAIESNQPIGIITHTSRSDTLNHVHLLTMGKSNNPNYGNDNLFLKMEGRKLYEYALNTVPQLIKDCIDKAKITLDDIKKVIIHQANTKMDDAMLSRLFRLFNVKSIPEDIMPMTISKYGNNSVATLPILIDLIFKGEFNQHEIVTGNYMIFASVGAGMNANALVYKAH
jgi:3-oxoacyl-[acyl-carrier-protein] synthase III